MKIRIDSAGRIIVPKKVRERLGLKQNSELQLEENADGITLTPVRQESAWVRDKHGWLVFTGTLAGNVDWDHLVEEDREARIREIGGW
jgi:AbrB family looped-hinge helix DNA binding protein